MTPTATLNQRVVRTLSLTGVGLLAAYALPLLVHSLPNSSPVPLGAQLLPIFFASLVLIVRGAPLAALITAIAAPSINAQLTGMPAGPMLPLLSVELLVFSGLLIAAAQLSPKVVPYLGPFAYLLAALSARLLLNTGAAPLLTLQNALNNAWPGLLLLLAIGALASYRRHQESSRQ
jgi:hypothetical protein